MYRMHCPRHGIIGPGLGQCVKTILGQHEAIPGYNFRDRFSFWNCIAFTVAATRVQRENLQINKMAL